MFAFLGRGSPLAAVRRHLYADAAAVPSAVRAAFRAERPVVGAVLRRLLRRKA